MVGSKTVFFMDEISTGLDSSTTYAIVKFLRDQTHALNYTTMVSLLQPAPESYDLFDDILLLAEGTPGLLKTPCLVTVVCWVLCSARQMCCLEMCTPASTSSSAVCRHTGMSCNRLVTQCVVGSVHPAMGLVW